MNRREFSALLPLLFAAPALAPNAEAQATGSQPAGAPAQLAKLTSGHYVWGAATNPQSPRVSHHYLVGMLPDAGDDHYITNASTTEPASYFVIAVGPPE